MANIGAKRVLEPHEKNNIFSNRESMSTDRPVISARPRGIRNYPINLSLVPEKVSPLADLTPVTRFWEGVVKRPSRSTAWIKAEATRSKIVNDLSRKGRGGFHIICLRAE
jgi:hypothetical protein